MNKPTSAKRAAELSLPDPEVATVQRVDIGGEQLLIELQGGEEPGDPGTPAAWFVMEGITSFGTQLAEEVEDVEVDVLSELAGPVGQASFSTAKLMLTAMEKHQGEMPHLSRARRRFVARTLDSLVTLLMSAAYEKGVTAKQLEEQGQTAIDTIRLLVQGGPDRIEALIEALEVPEVEGCVDPADEDAEARARLRLQALYQRVIRDSYSVADLTRQMRLSRQRLKQLRDQDRLFAIEVPYHRGWLYPRWQFEVATGRPREEMPGLIVAAREAGLDAMGFHLLMNNTMAGGGLSPLDLLDTGDEGAVIRILRGSDQ